MRKLLKLGLSISMVLSIAIQPVLGLGADPDIFDHYIYSDEGVPLKSPAAYLPEKIVQNDVFGLEEIPQIADIFVSNEANGKQVYLVDSKNNCIIVLNKDLELVKVISAVYKDGIPPEEEEPDPDDNDNPNPDDSTPSDDENGDNTSSGGENSTPEEPDNPESSENGGESSSPESSTPSSDTPVPAEGYAAPEGEPDGADAPDAPADGDEPTDGDDPTDGEPVEGEDPGDGEGDDTQTEVDGFITSFNKPEGVFVTNDGQIFLADTDNKRIVVMDIEGNLIQEYTDPGIVLLSKPVSFLPSKVAVDNGGRLYVVAKNVNRGLVQLDSEGDFIGFLGAPRVVPNLIEYFWKMISTEEQKKQMETFVPTEYNNVTIDESGFLYSTIGTLDSNDFTNAILTKDKSGTITPIRKLNNTGVDVLKRSGEYAPVGDIFQYWDLPSIIVDVALSDDGRYAMLDQQRGRVFTYDMDGNLLYIFGGSGTQFGQLSEASSVAYLDDLMLVADKSLGRITSYKVTEYAACINEAVELNFIGDYEASAAKWTEALQMNSNLYVAYVGLGKNELRKENYDKAMEYLEIANEKKYYSKAFKFARKDYLSGIFNIIGVVVVLLIVGIFVLRYLKKRKKKRGEGKQ